MIIANSYLHEAAPKSKVTERDCFQYSIQSIKLRKRLSALRSQRIVMRVAGSAKVQW